MVGGYRRERDVRGRVVVGGDRLALRHWSRHHRRYTDNGRLPTDRARVREVAVVSARAEGGLILGPQEAGGGRVEGPAVQRGRGRAVLVLGPRQQQRRGRNGDRLRDHVVAGPRSRVGDERIDRRTGGVGARHREDVHDQWRWVGQV